jgi:hypothetical protein
VYGAVIVRLVTLIQTKAKLKKRPMGIVRRTLIIRELDLLEADPKKIVKFDFDRFPLGHL